MNVPDFQHKVTSLSQGPQRLKRFLSFVSNVKQALTIQGFCDEIT